MVIKVVMGTRHIASSASSLLLLYLALVLFHFLMSLQMRGPLILADEIGYLGNARYLVGKGVMPNMAGTAFYHAGYSILISPAFWLSSDPERVYLFVLVINSFLISSLFLFLYYWLKNVLIFDHKISVLASLVTSLYPPFFLQSNIAWAENAIIPLFILPTIFLHLMVKRRSLSFGILFGFSVSFLYTIHPRSILILPISGFYLILLGLLGFLPLRTAGVSFAMLLTTYLATDKLHDHLRLLGWGGGGVLSITGILSPLLNIKGLIKIVVLMASQLWYMAVSTYSLVIVGFSMVALRIWQHRSVLKKKEPSSAAIHTLLFYLLACGGVFLTSALFMSSLRLNVDRLIYGRYNESFIALSVAGALGFVWENHYSKQCKNVLFFLLLFTLSGLSLVTLSLGYKLIQNPTICGFNVLGLFPVLGAVIFKFHLSSFLGVFVSSLYALVVILILTLVFKKERNAGIAILGSLFLIFSLVQHVYLFLPGAKRVESLVLPKVIRAIPDVKMVSYDQAYKRPIELYRYQYFLPQTRFLFFDSSKNEFPATEYFISSRFSEESKKMGAHLVALEKEGDLALWIKKEALQNKGVEELWRGSQGIRVYLNSCQVSPVLK